MTRSKYGNRKAKADGYTFDSQAEYTRYQQLLLLQRAGEIRALKVHPRYLLQESFVDATGKRWRAIHYEADFEYYENHEIVVEDVKGAETAVWKLKRKLFLKRHVMLTLRVIPVSEI